jgi:hypothetical protein
MSPTHKVHEQAKPDRVGFMSSSRLTNLLLATICVLLLWNVLAPGLHSVRAAGSHEYKWILINEHELEKTLNQLGQQGWAFKDLTEPISSAQRYLLLERDK